MIRATLQQLRLFAAVARNQSFTRAAEEVHLTQPAVSIQVKRLEEQIGAPLFETHGKRIDLTGIGRELNGACEDVFNRLARLEERIDEIRGEVAGPLRLAAATTAKYFLPYYLGVFLRNHPKVEPMLKVTNSASIIQRMVDNLDDLYIVSTIPDNLAVKSRPFLSDELVPFVAPDHPLVGRSGLQLSDIQQERFLFREHGSGIRRELEKRLAEYGVEISPYMELGSGEAIKQGVMAGIGIGVSSKITLRQEGEGHAVSILDVEGFPIHRQWQVAYLEGKRLSLAAQKFYDFLLESDGVPYES